MTDFTSADAFLLLRAFAPLYVDAAGTIPLANQAACEMASTGKSTVAPLPSRCLTP